VQEEIDGSLGGRGWGVEGGGFRNVTLLHSSLVVDLSSSPAWYVYVFVSVCVSVCVCVCVRVCM
jgi:hypothetical protein